MKIPINVDEYLSSFPVALKDRGEQLRAEIRKAAPDAEEIISYQMPAYRQKGIVVYFAIHNNHIGLYPASLSIEVFAPALAPYKRSKGTIQFPHDKPLPLELISDIVKFRVLENLEKSNKK
jgi:uncharacterized protein YdhG (YjbR/CyaY superfamily)